MVGEIMIRYLVVFVSLLLAAPSFADIYRWVDDRGTVNFTEDYGKVPARYRKKVKVIREGVVAPEVIETTTGESKGEESTAPAAAGNGAAAAKQGAAEKKKELYGGKDADTWRAEFEKLHADIKFYEDQVTDNQAKLDHPDNLSRAEYLGIQLGMKRLNEKVAALKDKLAALVESARRAGVPSEFWK